VTLTNEQKIEHQSAWLIMQSQYPGIEKWQRITVYEQVVAKGMSHEGALKAAHGCAKGDLPDIVFQADTVEEVGGLTIESGTFDPPLKTWDTRSFRYQKRVE
jgi:hypothetical protein